MININRNYLVYLWQCESLYRYKEIRSCSSTIKMKVANQCCYLSVFLFLVMKYICVHIIKEPTDSNPFKLDHSTTSV